MSPRLSIHNHAYLRGNDAKLAGKAYLRDTPSSVSSPDFSDGRSGKFVLWEPLTFHIASLVRHISDILLLRSKEQMIRVNARRVITTVQDMQAIGDAAKMDLPRKAMGKEYRSLGDVRFEPSVPSTMNLTGPYPARRSFTNLLPKSFGAGSILGHIKLYHIVGGS